MEQRVLKTHVENLQTKRELVDSPFVISSGYRCVEYNKEIGGATKSQHILGNATDIIVVGMLPSEFANKCEDFDGLGRYDTFTHLDSRGTKARWNFTKVSK